MADEKGSWKRFRRTGFDSKKFYRRMRRAETTTTRHAHRFVLSKLDSLRNAKQHIILWLLIVGVLIVAVALQMIWYQQAYRTMAWKSGGTYAEAVLGPIDTLDPLYVSTKAELSASRLIFSSLYRYDDTGHLSGDLATSLNSSKDGREYTATLRHDAHWSDGVKVTADDVVFTVNLMKSPDAQSVMYRTGSWANVTATAVDEYTVKFTLPAPNAPFPHALTFSVLPEHLLSDIAPGMLRQNSFSISPVGSGPFTVKLLQVSPDRKHKIVNLSASENYYRGSPKLTRFQLHAYASTDDMTHALRTGEVNAVADIDASTSSLPKGVTVKDIPIDSGVYGLFNTTAGPLKNKLVRQALQVGTDTKDVRQAVDYPTPPLHLPFVNGQLTGAGIPVEPHYDAKRAEQLLTKAGWKLAKGSDIRQDKHKKPLTLQVVTVKNSVYEKVLERLAGQWRKLGIDVKTTVADPDSSTEDFVQGTLQPRNYDVLLYERVIGADPDVYVYWHSSQATELGYNFSNYKSDVSDDILSTARSTNDPRLRNEKYKAFARQWMKDAPAIGLYQSVMRYAYRSSVQPVIPRPTTTGLPSSAERFSDILYWSAQQVPVYKTP